MPQSGRVSVAVNTLLKVSFYPMNQCLNYILYLCFSNIRNDAWWNGIDHVTPMRALQHLFPVSFAQAKDWMIRQKKAQSTALESGAVNEDAQEVIADQHEAGLRIG